METQKMSNGSGGDYHGRTKKQLEQMVSDLEKQLIRKDAELSVYKRLYEQTNEQPEQTLASYKSQQLQHERDQFSERAFRQLTLKQHAALQMMLRGASNREIAQRFQVAEPTAKVYVRGIFQKFGVHDRSDVILRAQPIFRAITDDEYKYIAGLPKDWDQKFSDGSDETTQAIRKKKGDK